MIPRRVQRTAYSVQRSSRCSPPYAGRSTQNAAVFRAFSLVELVISMAILAVGLIGTMRVFPVGLRASQRAEESSRATMVGQRTLELLKVTACEAIAEGTQDVEGFTVTTRLATPAQTELVDPTRLTLAEISVGWTLQSRPRSLTFLTYLRCPSPQ